MQPEAGPRSPIGARRKHAPTSGLHLVIGFIDKPPALRISSADDASCVNKNPGCFLKSEIHPRFINKHDRRSKRPEEFADSPEKMVQMRRLCQSILDTR